jgi:cob(I)alamin adenosyltransferase
MLYTRKGDKGITRTNYSENNLNGQAKTFGCNQKISKSSAVTEALGVLDETNSFLGLVKAKLNEKGSTFLKVQGRTFKEIIHEAQENLFIIQAELAGAREKTISEKKVKELEAIIDAAEKEMPPIRSFFIPGATELGALFDVSRAVARRAERRVVAVADEGKIKIGKHSLAYLNRLSSLLYALARLSSHKSGIKEEPPSYK